MELLGELYQSNSQSGEGKIQTETNSRGEGLETVRYRHMGPRVEILDFENITGKWSSREVGRYYE